MGLGKQEIRLGKQEIRLEKQIRDLTMNVLLWLLKGFAFYPVTSNRDPLSSFKPPSNMISFACL